MLSSILQCPPHFLPSFFLSHCLPAMSSCLPSHLPYFFLFSFPSPFFFPFTFTCSFPLFPLPLPLPFLQLVGILLAQILINQIRDQIKLQLYNQQHRADPWY